jgi:hypothetical protein
MRQSARFRFAPRERACVGPRSARSKIIPNGPVKLFRRNDCFATEALRQSAACGASDAGAVWGDDFKVRDAHVRHQAQ